MDRGILREILRGGLEKIHEAGAVLAGGHSVDDPELKYGLSITGLVSPAKVWTNAGAQPGDALILTKPLGTGILATAIKGGLISAGAEKQVIEVMATLNNKAAWVMSAYPVHACTDITGFGLLGHALEMARESKVTISMEVKKVPILSEVLEYSGMGLVPAGSYANRNFCASHVRQIASIDPLYLDILADAQTSGGLLFALPAGEARQALSNLHAAGVIDAALIGEVSDRGEGVIELR